MLQTCAGPATAWFGILTYWYERIGNTSQGWLDKVKERDGDELTVSVHVIPAAVRVDADGAGDGIVRPVRAGDLPRCVELINRTHEGLDLFRPYTVEFLESHLDDPAWGPKPAFWSPVFGWEDYAVVEDGAGAVVACGGLWDRGRDIREVWRNEQTAEQRTIEATALLDWGYEAGRADAMARAAAVVPRAHGGPRPDPPVGARSSTPRTSPRWWPRCGPELEVRRIRTMAFQDERVQIVAELTRPYTDLAYW